MWTRAELEREGRAAMMKHSYWMMFSVSLVAYLLTDAFADILDMLSGEQHLLPLRGGLNLTVNGRWDIWLNIPWLQMLQLQVALFFALIAIMLMVFIGNVIKVGTNRYYLGAASGPQPFSTSFSAFSSHYLNVVKVMFLVSVKILAWSLLLVIPGIVKSYEYRMIPYLLAQQPDMRAEDAFALSRKMTMGHKAEMFVLSLSFLGWLILGTLAFRIGVWFAPSLTFESKFGGHSFI